MAKGEKIIVFDFGNVLINLNFESCFAAFGKILNVDWGGNKVPKDIQEVIGDYDKGIVSDEGFVEAFKKYKPSAAAGDIMHAWNLIVEDIPGRRLEMLLHLRKKYKVALLSNTNPLHIKKVYAELESEHGIKDFEEKYFDYVFYSYRIGLRKPELPIFLYVADRMEAEPENILFVDDMKVNVIAAKSQGWNGVVHNPEKEISDEISRYIQFYGFNND